MQNNNLAFTFATSEVNPLGRAFIQITELGTGKLKSNVNHIYPLADVGEAHRAIEARETTGSIVLIP